jgi:hypothetical protein
MKAAVELVGDDNFTWDSDYPHPDGTFPWGVKAMLDQDVAKALIGVTGADYLLVVYSEWTIKTGGFIPTTKPLTKNVISVFDSDGKQEFKGRIDKMGPKTLGAFNAVYVDEDTIDYWVGTFKDSLAAMYAGRKK